VATKDNKLLQRTRRDFLSFDEETITSDKSIGVQQQAITDFPQFPLDIF
jgi:hypothetical protein